MLGGSLLQIKVIRVDFDFISKNQPIHLHITSDKNANFFRNWQSLFSAHYVSFEPFLCQTAPFDLCHQP